VSVKIILIPQRCWHLLLEVLHSLHVGHQQAPACLGLCSELEWEAGYSLCTHDQASLHSTWWFAAYKVETLLFYQAAFQFLPNPKLLMYNNYNAGMKHKHKVAICLHIIYGKVSLQFLQSQGFQEFSQALVLP